MVIALGIALVHEICCLILNEAYYPVENHIKSIAGIVLPLAAAFLLKLYLIIILRLFCSENQEAVIEK